MKSSATRDKSRPASLLDIRDSKSKLCAVVGCVAVVERLSLTGELSRSCARPTAGG